jgi:hypothetical protein
LVIPVLDIWPHFSIESVILQYRLDGRNVVFSGIRMMCKVGSHSPRLSFPILMVQRYDEPDINY